MAKDLGLLSDALQEKLLESARATTRLAALTELSLDLAAMFDRQSLMETFTRGARDIVACRYALVAVLSEDRKSVQDYWVDGVQREKLMTLGAPRFTAGPALTLLDQNAPIRIFDSQYESIPLAFEQNSIFTKSLLGVPLTNRKGIFGWLCFAEKIMEEQFSYEDERLAVTLAVQFAVWYDNVRLHAAQERYTHQLESEILQRNQAEEMLHKLSSAVEQSGDSVIITNKDGIIEYVNPRFENLTGYSKEEALGQTPRLLKSGLYSHNFYERLWNTILSGKVFRTQFANRKKDGEIFHEEQTITPLKSRDGVVTHFVSTGKDITERKRAEECLAAQYEVTRALAESTSLKEAAPRILRILCQTLHWDVGVLWTVHPRAKVLRCCEVWHITGDELSEFKKATKEMEIRLGDGLTGTVCVNGSLSWVPDVQNDPNFLRSSVAAMAGLHAACFFPVHSDNHSIAVLEFFSKEIRAQDRGMAQIFSSLGDQIAQFIERKQSEEARLHLERQLVQSQKIEAIGQLAGGVAHDFNNTLMAIGGYSELMIMQLPEEDPLRRIAYEIQKSTTQGASLTRQLLAFSRKQVLTPKVLDLNQSIKDMENMLQRLIGDNMLLSMVYAKNLGYVKADPGQIEQVLMNLAVNARDAMPAGGKLTVETSNEYLDETYARNHLEVAPGNYVRLAVSDSGSGMSEELLLHIFEPFFTTKEEGKGTGLGLSTVYGIVKQSGGYISVYSQIGHGTTFKIYFPRLDSGTKIQPTEEDDQPEHRGMGEAILLVDDNDAIRYALGEYLQLKGYVVLQARHGMEALETVRNFEGPIDLLISDLVMPEMNGLELGKRLRVLYPKVKILYMSGYTEEAIRHQGVLELGSAFVSKPIPMGNLMATIRAILSSES